MQTSPSPAPPPPGLPKFREVAWVLRGRIRDGIYPPGSDLPSENDLETEFGYDRGTIRRALALLRLEGLVVSEQGRRTTVREHRRIPRDIAASLRREYDTIDSGIPNETGVFRALTGIDARVDVDTEYEWLPAPAGLAAAFDVPAGTEVLRRRYSYTVDGDPYQIVSSYLLASTARGTLLETPAHEAPGRGAMRHLADIGIRVDYADVRIIDRPATPEEAAGLHIPDGDHVLDFRRRLYAGGPVVEVADSVVAAGGIEVHMQIPLGGER